MRFLQKRFIREKMRKVSRDRIETRNAVIYSIQKDQRRCLVKIQNSTQTISAWFPQNWTEIPEWIKVNNAVTLRHTGGKEIGRLEVVGHGELVPSTYVIASSTTNDAVLTGMTVTETSPQSMSVTINTGTYRIAGATYSGTAQSATFTAPSSGYYRYDTIVIGTDGVVDVVQGTAAASSPVMPSTPAGHVRLAYILLWGGITIITNAEINRLWAAAAPSTITVTMSDDDLAWGQTTCTITVKIYSQYGALLGMSGGYFKVAFVSGNGTLYSAESGNSAVLVGQHSSASSYAFTYTRGGNDPGDSSPYFTVTYTSGSVSLTASTRIILRNAVGAVMV